MPRPSAKPTGEVWRLLQQWQKAQAEKAGFGRGPSQGEMAERFDVSDSLLSNWKFMESEMPTKHMRTVSEVTGIAYDELASAVRADNDAVVRFNAQRRKDGDEGERAPANTQPGSGPDQLARRRQSRNVSGVAKKAARKDDAPKPPKVTDESQDDGDMEPR